MNTNIHTETRRPRARTGPLLLTLLLSLLLLASCGKQIGNPNVYDVDYNGTTYTVNQNDRTISFNDHVCHFEITNNVNGVHFKVTYPDGSSFWKRWTGNAGYGGWSDDYDETRYVSGDTLWKVLELDHANDRNNSGHWFFGILLAGLGIFQTASPRTAWWLSHGWRFRDAEPSDLALGLGRVGGVVLIIIGIICFFV